MEYRLDITDSALNDLNDIVSYIAETLYAPTAATHFTEAVEMCYDNLKSQPFMYAACDMPELAEKGYRRAPVKNYLILYKVDELVGIVRIHRIFYGARDYIDLI
jgi:addiction module RelE/StbE family toxin